MSEPMHVVFWCEGDPLDGARKVYPEQVSELLTFECITPAGVTYPDPSADELERYEVTWHDTGILDQFCRVFVRGLSRRMGGGDGDAKPGV